MSSAASHRSSTSGAPFGFSFVAPCLILAAIILAYGNTLFSPFVFDDDGAVVNNPTIQQLWPLSVPLSPPSDGSTATGRPIVNFTFALNYAISGLNGWSYHATNLLIHAGAALALFGLARRTLSAPVLRQRFMRAGEAPAFFIALLWGVHPLLTESVSCVAQRTESLCGLFFFVTFYAFARGAAATTPWRWWGVSVCACLLGMGTKEIMAVAPLLVLLFDRTFLAGSFGRAWQLRRNCHLALALTLLPLLWLVLSGGGTRGASAGLGLGISPWEYLLTQARALTIYLKLSLWPHPLILDYGTATVKSLGEVWAQGALILGLLGGTIWALRFRPVTGFFGAWFFMILAPSSSVIPLVTQTIAEHRMYLPLLAPVALLVGAAYRFNPRLVTVSLSVVSLLLASVTWFRNRDYRSELALWSDNIAKLPQNPRPHANLGIALQRRDSPADSLAHFNRALSLQADYVTALHGLGTSLLQLNRPAEALVPLQRAVQLAPEHADARLALGNALVKSGRTAEALVHFGASLEIQPAADAFFNFGVALRSLDREEEAIVRFESARLLDPGLTEARTQLLQSLARSGLQFARAGQFAQAENRFRRAAELDPQNAAHHANLGNTLLMQERAREAIVHYEAALRLKPDDPRTRENLALAIQAATR